MTVRTWQVETDGKVHTVELDHGTLSGKRIITVDGRPAVQMQTLDHLVWDVGGSYPVPIGNKEGVVRIRMAAMSLLGCRYDLVWDGTSISPQPVPRRPNTGVKLWLAVATVICSAVLAGAIFLPAPSVSSAGIPISILRTIGVIFPTLFLGLAFGALRWGKWAVLGLYLISCICFPVSAVAVYSLLGLSGMDVRLSAVVAASLSLMILGVPWGLASLFVGFLQGSGYLAENDGR